MSLRTLVKILYGSQYFKVIVIGLIIAYLGYFLRLQQFNWFPPPNDTYDELKGVFNGISLLTEGKPKSWSWYETYGNFPTVHIRNAEFRIVEPWFEEPPLFSLIMGGYAISKGMDGLDKVDTGAMRWPMLKIAALDIFILFLIVYLLKGLIEAIIAGLLYATIPTFVLGSRLPISENMITTVMLISLLLLILYTKSQKNIFLIPMAALGSSAFLMKQTGVFVPVALIILLLALKKFKASFIVGLVLLILIIGWFLYGYYYDWSLFLQMMIVQSGRELFMPSQVINLFRFFRIGESAMAPDGWIIWGWISIVVYSLFISKKQDTLSRLMLPITISSYLIFFSIMSGHNKGWYRFPFYPFLAWASAAFFIEIVKNPKLLTTLFFISIPVSSSYIYGTGEHLWSKLEIKLYQASLLLLIAVPVLYELVNTPTFKKVVQGILIGALIVAIIYNIRTIVSFQDRFWY